MTQSQRIAIVGAAGGLGRAVARRLHAEGARLSLGVRDETAVADLAAETEADVHEVDGSDFAQMDTFLGLAGGDEGLDGVVNCAGSLLLKPAHLTTADEFAQTIAANLTTAFATLRAAARAIGTDGGSVVLVASAAATIGLQNHEAIAAAKGGVAGLTRAGAATYASRGLRVNAIAPGLVDTPLTAKIMNSETARASSLDLHPSGRAGQPEELASLVAWLLGPDSQWVTGQVWGIDGGLSSLKTMPRKTVGRAASGS